MFLFDNKLINKLSYVRKNHMSGGILWREMGYGGFKTNS